MVIQPSIDECAAKYVLSGGSPASSRGAEEISRVCLNPHLLHLPRVVASRFPASLLGEAAVMAGAIIMLGIKRRMLTCGESGGA